MIDAYTIGIKLALDDGISAGIAAVRRDLATLDREVAFTAAGLVALRRLGQEISIVGPAVVHRAPGSGAPAQASPKSQAPEQPTPLPSNLGNAAPPEPDLTPPPEVRNAVAPARPSKDTEPLVIRQAGQPQGSGLAAPTARQRPSISPMPPDRPPPPSPTLPDRYPAPATPRPRPKSAAQFAPRLPDRPQPVVAEQPSSRLLPAPISFPAGTALLSVGPSPSRDPVNLSSPAELTPRSGTPAAPRARPDPLVPLPVATSSVPTWATSAAPRARTLAQAFGEVNRERFTDNPSVAGRPRPQGRHQLADHEQAQSHASGDITLDGTRLGRWMGDALARLGERPLSGSTGLDPRVTPDWPAMQGH